MTRDVLQHSVFCPFALARYRVLERGERPPECRGLVLVRAQPLPVPDVGYNFLQRIATTDASPSAH